MNKFNTDFCTTKKIKKTKKIVFISFISTFLILGSITMFLILGMSDFFKSAFSPNEKLIQQTKSADGIYQVEAYLIDNGATTDWAVKCYLKTDSTSKKTLIYNVSHIKDVEMNWEDNNTIYINNQKIDLANGSYDFKDS